MGNGLRTRTRRYELGQDHEGNIRRSPAIFTISYRDSTDLDINNLPLNTIPGQASATLLQERNNGFRTRRNTRLPDDETTELNNDLSETILNSDSLLPFTTASEENTTIEKQKIISDKEEDNIQHLTLTVDTVDGRLIKTLSCDSFDSAYSDKSLKSNNSNNSGRCGVETMVDIHMKLLEENIKVVEILPHLLCILEQRDILRIKTIATYEPVKAVNEMITAIKKCVDRGKWQLFIEALDAAEYRYVVLVLKGLLDPIKDENNKRLVKLFHTKLIDNVHVPDMIDRLFEKNVLSKVDHEQIQKEYHATGDQHAAFTLLMRISTRHPNWYVLFIETLRDCKMDYIVEEIEDLHEGPLSLKQDRKDCSSRKLPPLPKTSCRKESNDVTVSKSTCVEDQKCTLDTSFVLCDIRQQIERKTNELKELRAKYLVLEAEEAVYETIPCDEKRTDDSDECLKMHSETTNIPDALCVSLDKTMENLDHDIPDRQPAEDIDIDHDSISTHDVHKTVPLMARLVINSVNDMIASKMDDIKDELKLHITKEIQSSEYARENEKYTYGYRNVHIGLSPVKLFDANTFYDT